MDLVTEGNRKRLPIVNSHVEGIHVVETEEVPTFSTLTSVKGFEQERASRTTHVAPSCKSISTEEITSFTADRSGVKKAVRSRQASPQKVASVRSVQPSESVSFITESDIAPSSTSYVLPEREAVSVLDRKIPDTSAAEMQQAVPKTQSAKSVTTIEPIRTAIADEKVTFSADTAVHNVPAVTVTQVSKVAETQQTASFMMSGEN